MASISSAVSNFAASSSVKSEKIEECNILVKKIVQDENADIDVIIFSMEYRPVLFHVYRSSFLAHNNAAVEVTRNLILRNYFFHRHYELAEKFIQATALAMNTTESGFDKVQSENFSVNLNCTYSSESQISQFFLYVAIVKTVLLKYSEANAYIEQAKRKNNLNDESEKSILIAKFSILIRLLNANYYVRKEEFSLVQQSSLQSYFNLAACFHTGEVQEFQSVLDKYSTIFREDNTLEIVHRLFNNMIKITLIKITKSYSRISLNAIASKLAIPIASLNEVKYIVMKAIKDKVINSKIDFETQDLISYQVNDVYHTTQPLFDLQNGFERNMLNQAVVCRSIESIQIEDDKKDKAEEERKKVIEANEKDLAKAMEEGIDSDVEWMD